jgi:hypothetical protein
VWRWTATGGIVALDDQLVLGKQLYFSGTSRRYLSADGNIIVVERFDSPGVYRWTEGDGFQMLPVPSGNARRVVDMTPDGKWVLGRSEQPFTAWLWSEATGTRTLTDILIAQGDGPSIAGWTGINGYGISADGRAIAGTGINPDGFREAFVIYLVPEPTSAALGLLALACFFCFRAVRNRRTNIPITTGPER